MPVSVVVDSNVAPRRLLQVRCATEYWIGLFVVLLIFFAANNAGNSDDEVDAMSVAADDVDELSDAEHNASVRYLSLVALGLCRQTAIPATTTMMTTTR